MFWGWADWWVGMDWLGIDGGGLGWVGGLEMGGQFVVEMGGWIGYGWVDGDFAGRVGWFG